MIQFIIIQYYTHYTIIITYPVHERQVLGYQPGFLFLSLQYGGILVVRCKIHYEMLFCRQ